MQTQIDRFAMIGNRFGWLTVVAFHGQHRSDKLWHAICDCGRHHISHQSRLRSGHTKSCGCLRRSGRANLIHGQTGTPEYDAWCAMKARCFDVNNPKFADYGARGIAVCEEWVFDFMAFLTHVGPRPSKRHSLGRQDNDGNYEPGNVRWETPGEQARNKRNNRYLIVSGERKLLSEWARISGISIQHLQSRLRSAKWTPELAVTTPIGVRGGYRPRRGKTCSNH
jgi:hypothetical protein